MQSKPDQVTHSYPDSVTNLNLPKRQSTQYQQTKSNMSLSRDELIEKIGGENHYNFLVTSFCESIQQDAGLKDLFLTYDLELLADHMTALLDIVLAQCSDSEPLDESTQNKVIMSNFSLFQAGMNARHFKKLQADFVYALHDAWVEEDLIEECNRRFTKLRAVFEEEGAAMEHSAMEGRVVELRMMAATYA